MFEYAPDADSFVWDDPASASRILGADTLAEARNLSNFHACLSPDGLKKRERVMAGATEHSDTYRIEYQIQPSTGDAALWVEERGCWSQETDTAPLRLIGVITTIDDQKQKEAHLSYLASYDELTGHLNRSRLREVLETTIIDTRNGGGAAAYLVIGIDDLGAINEDFGFDVADEVIVNIGRRLKSALYNHDHIGRSAGNKFGILLTKCSIEDIRERCRALISAVRSSVVETTHGGIAASVSIGAVPLPSDIQTSEVAMARAEAALDEARRAGRGGWSAFSERTDVVRSRRRNSHLSDVILTALNERRVRIAYQPIVADLNEAPHHFECLVRMVREDGEVLPAGEFISAAERLGLVHLLDRRVLELVTQDLSTTPDITVNVNVSWETIKDPVWAEGYLAHLRANAHLANRITVELTETSAVDAFDVSQEFIADVKEIGCKFAIDDFGAGYTSFRNLKALDIDILKIDGSFVTGVASSRENQLFVRTLFDLARNFGVKTVAEWVDNQADAMMLKGLGVDYLQGFFIGKPEINPTWVSSASEKSPHLRKAR